MTKEELKQEAEECMHNALFWLKLPISKENVEQGGSYILKLLEPREKRIAELEERCANYEMQLSKMEKGTCDICKETEKDRKLEELEQENAKLKEKLGDKVMQKQKDRADLVWKLKTANEQKADQLTKAKELLSRLKSDFKNFAFEVGVEPISETYFEVEKFLKESE